MQTLSSSDLLGMATRGINPFVQALNRTTLPALVYKGCGLRHGRLADFSSVASFKLASSRLLQAAIIAWDTNWSTSTLDRP